MPAPRAPAGSADATRRWALRGAAGDRFPGLTRPEADAVAAGLTGVADDRWELALVEIRLPALLSDGAGPHLLDADGRITLVLGAHPELAGLRIAMGEPSGRRARHALGAVRAGDRAPLWWWVARAEVPHDRRVAALDELAACPDAAALTAWATRRRAGADGG